MPANKRQHFVPQFYLKRFSENKKSIRLYNIENRRLVENAPIAKQCYKNYLYGSDRILENFLANEIEAPAASAINCVNSANKRGELTRDQWLSLFNFLTIQIERTVSRIEWLQSIQKQLRPKYDAMWRGIDQSTEIQFEELLAGAITRANLTYPHLTDLDCIKLLANQEDSVFITSDAPVLLNNEYLHGIKDFSTTALTASGLQILLPINASTVLLFYDSSVYDLKDSNSFVQELTSASVSLINGLQCRGAYKNIYFDRSYEFSDSFVDTNRLVGQHGNSVFTSGVEHSDAGSREYVKFHIPDKSVQLELCCFRKEHITVSAHEYTYRQVF